MKEEVSKMGAQGYNDILTIADLNRISFFWEIERTEMYLDYECGRDYYDQYVDTAFGDVCCGVTVRFYFDGAEVAHTYFDLSEAAQRDIRIFSDDDGKHVALPDDENVWLEDRFDDHIWTIPHEDGTLSFIDLVKTAYAAKGKEIFRGVQEGDLVEFALCRAEPDDGAVLYEMGVTAGEVGMEDSVGFAVSHLVDNTFDEI